MKPFTGNISATSAPKPSRVEAPSCLTDECTQKTDHMSHKCVNYLKNYKHLMHLQRHSEICDKEDLESSPIITLESD